MAGRTEQQMSGLAGEFFVAAELLKRGYQVSVTFGNAKAIDLFVHNERLDVTFNVQVKTLRRPNVFLLRLDKVHTDHIYAFVLLNDADKAVEYFFLRGKELEERERELFTSGRGREEMSGITNAKLRPYKGNWTVFDPQT